MGKTMRPAFKDYLLKETVKSTDLPSYIVSVNFLPQDATFAKYGAFNSDVTFLERFQEYLQSKSDFGSATLEFDEDDYLAMRLPIKETSEATRGKLSEHALGFLLYAKKFSGIDELTIQDHYVTFDQPLPDNFNLIDYGDIVIEVPINSRLTSLSGIGKRLKCEILGFKRANRIQEAALSIMQIKDLEQIAFMDQLSKNEKWLVIIRDHVIGDGDLMECQEDLIQAGLKQYARL